MQFLGQEDKPTWNVAVNSTTRIQVLPNRITMIYKLMGTGTHHVLTLTNSEI